MFIREKKDRFRFAVGSFYIEWFEEKKEMKIRANWCWALNNILRMSNFY